MLVMFFSILSTVFLALAPADGPARVVRDGAGRDVSAPASPRRIVSLSPSATEILFALGAGDLVVGVTRFCDYPAEVAALPRIGGLINPDLERIISLRPDLAIASTAGNYRDDAERIERVGIPVYTIDTPSIEATLRTLEDVGKLLGRGREAAGLVSGLRGRVDALREAGRRGPRPRTLFVIEPDPLIAPGEQTFLGEALVLAGADLVTADAPAKWAQYDFEQVMAMRPEVILTAEANRSWAESIGGQEAWSRIPAVASGSVYVISDSILHPGPRLVDGMEEVRAILSGTALK